MKNKKFEVKNLLGNSQKRTYRREVFKIWRGGFLACLFILFFAFLIYRQSIKSSVSQPLSQTITNPVVEVIAQEDKYISRGYKYCYDVQVCIRDIGDELGFSNKDILIAMNIAKNESGYRTDAINLNTNKTADIGVFQINDVHGKRISREDRMDFIKNIIFAYTLRQEQGNWNAWSVCHNGLVNCN